MEGNSALFYILVLSIFAFGLVGSIAFYLRYRKSPEMPVSTSTSYVKGLIALLDGDQRSAFENLRDEVRTNPRNFDAYLRLGNLFREKRQFQKALQVHHQLTARQDLADKQQTSLSLALALDYDGLKQNKKAITRLKEALEKDPGDLNVYRQLFKQFEKIEEWNNAFDTLRKIFEIEGRQEPDLLAIYLSEIGRKHLEKGDNKQAVQSFKRALKLDKKCSPAYLYWGDLYLEQEDLTLAIDRWEKIVEHCPEEAFVLINRIEKAFLEVGMYDRVEDIYEKLNHEQPQEISYSLALASVYLRKGMFAEANSQVGAALESEPDNNYARLYKVYINYKMGDSDEALKELYKLVKIQTGIPAKFTCSKCSYESREPLWYCPRCMKYKTFFSGINAA